MKKPEKSEKKPKESLREKLAESFEVSKEITLNVGKITLIGERDLTVENYSGIMEYSENCITVNLKPAPLKITGSFLEISVISKEILYITGKIKKVSYMGGAEKKKGVRR